jgi:cytoskeletal protein CcmA (bactofilin family)
MSSNSTYANGSEASASEQPVGAHKLPFEWAGLVGFRRRDGVAAAVKPVTEPLAPEKQAKPLVEGDAVVVVGKGANIVGEITNCSQVEIAGALEGKVVAEAVIVRAGGCLKGHVCAQRAEVHGSIEGQVQVADHLDIRSTGQVSGELTYGKLSVASGGCLAGTIEIVPHARAPHAPAYQMETAFAGAPAASEVSSVN